MRFQRLAVPAFGPFTDLELTFPAAVADLHLLYGPNEAGKSALLRAIRDLLYGIEARTPDNFLHDYKKLRIAAAIEDRAGKRLEFQRRKGTANTLLDPAGQALPDTALDVFLGPVDREFFRTMFGLGSDELRRGADDLLQGKGDLGQALFSASLAGTPIHRVLAKLDAEARTLFDGKAWKSASIRPALTTYEETLRQAKAALIRPEAWDDALRERETARQAKAELEAALQALRGRQDWLGRCLDALPILGRLSETEARLAALPPLPDLPAGFADEATTALARHARAGQDLAALQQRSGDLARRLETLLPRAELLARAGEIDTLAQDLAVYRQNRKVLATRQAEAEQAETALRTGLRGLGLDGEPALVERLRLPLAAQLALREAATALENADRSAAEQRRGAERLHAERDKTAARLAQLPQLDVAPLREAYAACAPAIAAARGLAEQAAHLAARAQRLASQQQRLPGAPADPEAVYRLPMPAAARLRRCEAEAAEHAGQARQLEAARRETGRRLRDLKAKLARLEQRGALPTPAALAAARERREQGWALVLTCWKDGAPEPDWHGAPLAASYPAAVGEADGLADRLREEAEAVAQAEELRLQVREAEAILQEQAADQARLEQARQTWQTDWSVLWRACALTPAGPAEMLEWRDQWSEFRTRFEAWRELRDGLEAARTRIREAEARLRPWLDGADRPLLELRDLAERRLREADESQGERRALELRLGELRSEADLLAQRRHSLEQELEQARTRWQRHCAVLGLDTDTRPATALPVLEAHLALIARYDAWTGLNAELRERRRAIEAYEGQVRTLADGLGAGPANAEAQVDALGLALAESRDLAARRRQVQEDLEREAARLPQAEREAAAAAQALGTVLAQAGVGEPAALRGLLADLETRRQIAAEHDALHAALHLPARGEALPGFIERVRAEHGETLAVERDTLEAHIREQEGTREQAIQRLARAEDAKAGLEAGGTAAADHLQDSRYIAARVRQDAARYLRLRLATRFLQDQIDTFRARSQGPLLARAGALFRRMTGDRFSGLGTTYAQDDTPRLVGLKGGLEIPVEGMSEGTRDQLYLALRLAAIERHLEHHEPMPLILDDLLVTFDDPRSRALLPLLHDLAGKVQVLLFTHHRHILELAQEVLPTDGLHLHELRG